MSHTTAATPPAGGNPAPEPFPISLDALPDSRWAHEIVALIVADLPRLSDGDRQVVYEDLIDLRTWTYQQAVAA